MTLELGVAIAALIVQGPIVWWLRGRHRKEDNMTAAINEVKASIRTLHNRIDGVESNAATEDYVDKHIEHVKEVVSVQFTTIMESLTYIRKRLDEQQDRRDKD